MIDRMMDVLNCFSLEHPQRTPAEIQAETGIPRSTVYRILDALVHYDLCSYDPIHRMYSLGPALVPLAGIVLANLDLRHSALPYMKQLRDETGESVNLNVRQGMNRVCIEKVESRHEIREISYLGIRTVLHAGASGKVLLAFGDDSFLERYLATQTLEPMTSTTIINPELLREEVRKVRARGYSISLGERVSGAASFSAPVRDHSGRCVAALTVSGPAFRLTPQVIDQHIPALVRTAERISRALGWRETTSDQKH